MTFSGEGTNFTLVLPLQVGLIPDGIANTWGQLSPQVHCSAFHPGRFFIVLRTVPSKPNSSIELCFEGSIFTSAIV